MARNKPLPTQSPSRVEMEADEHMAKVLRGSLVQGFPGGSFSASRHAIFETVMRLGWENTFAVIASCLRLYGGVETVDSKLPKATRDLVFAVSEAVDQLAADGREIDKAVRKEQK